MKKATLLFVVILSVNSLLISQTLEWAKSMGGLAQDGGYSIAVDDSGNVYTTGSFGGKVDFDPNADSTHLTAAGSSDIFIQKLDAGGNLLWAKSIGGTHSDGGSSIAVDVSGNVYTTGAFQGTVDFDPNTGMSHLTAVDSSDVFIQKLDAGGNLLWAKSVGGTGPDRSSSIAVDGSGNVYTIGSFKRTVDFDPNAGTSNLTSAGHFDIFIQKLDSGGNFLWAKNMGGPDWDSGNAIVIDDSGNVYTTGQFQGMADFDPNVGTSYLTAIENEDVFIQKLDAGGNLVWVKSMGGTDWAKGYSITVDGSDNVYTTGYFIGTVDFDPNAGTANLTAVDKNDIYITKLDAGGNFLWAKSMGGNGGASGGSITVDGSGNVYTTGFFYGTVDFDPNAGTTNITSVMGVADIYIQKLDAGGNLLWVKSIGEADADVGTSIAIDGSGNLFTTGFFSGTVNFDPGAGTSNLTAVGQWDIFILKLHEPGSGITESFQQSAINLYPNPSSGIFVIELPEEYRTANLHIFDGVGRKVYQGKLTQTENEVNLAHLSTGIYHVSLVLDSGEKVYGKVVLD